MKAEMKGQCDKWRHIRMQPRSREMGSREAGGAAQSGEGDWRGWARFLQTLGTKTIAPGHITRARVV